eukprot:TRINITY_DN2669_c0_g1_i3.p1 TRINITY_DN2669_c0_g1~~TRINITY_DN2669_c0_g1_i3.p1  ORF type:complete len:474 (+),score=171.17 TRINITY_DN2669_c0_g1_i3:76-1422(+)
MRAAALLLAAAAGGAEASNSSAAATWCYAPPLSAGAAPPAGSDFRGSYRDLSLYHLATPAAPRPPSCNSIVVQRRQDEGLWVLELKTPADARAAERKIKRDGITVARALNASLIVLGGENLPDRTGYDACGAEPGVAVVPVPEYTVRLPRRVPAAELARLRQSVTVARKNDPVQKAVDEVSEASAKATVSALQEHNTRNSYSEGVRDAQKWIEERFAGYGFSVSRFEWRADMSPVVVAELKGSAHPEKVIVAGAHYDSRSTDNTSPTQRAPGADDNASGTSAMLEIARVIHALGLKLEYTLRLCAFSGEEQGLLGSRALAREWANQGVDVVAMFNADMLGWQIPDQPVTLGFKDRYISEETTEVVRGLVAKYVPGLPTAYSSSCCSDYQSFYENGFASVGFFENAVAASAYPHYHTSTDLLKYVNTAQLAKEIKGVLASVLTFAGVAE